MHGPFIAVLVDLGGPYLAEIIGPLGHFLPRSNFFVTEPKKSGWAQTSQFILSDPTMTTRAVYHLSIG